MATVFRVQKTKDFTVMSNHHLKNKDLSLRSKGLLSFMLSLPEDWDYSLKGLATLNKEGIDAIRSAINELEAFGYIERSRVRNEKGQLGENEYIIHELPYLLICCTCVSCIIRCFLSVTAAETRI